MNENSWEITEPDLGYQAAFNLLLSQFATDLTPPKVLGANLLQQTSAPQIKVLFNESVTASTTIADAILQQVTTSGALVTIANLTGSYDVTNSTATYSAGALADGNYRLTVNAGGVKDSAGNTIAAKYSYDFFILAGDANHDRSVDNADFTVLFNHFTQHGTYADGDFNGDGIVDNADFTILFNNFTKTLPPPPVAPAVTTVPTAASTTITSRRTAALSPVHVWQTVAPLVDHTHR